MITYLLYTYIHILYIYTLKHIFINMDTETLKYIHIHIYIYERRALYYTVKPLITNTSEEFIKCRLDNFSMRYYIT